MFKSLTFLFLFFMCIFDLQAMRLVPFVHSMCLDDGEYVVEYELTNKMEQPLAFEIKIYLRKLDNNGYELQLDINDKDTDSFVAFPAQIIMPAQSSRRIKLRWIDSKQKLVKEKAYRVAFSQYTMDFIKKKNKNDKASLEIRLRVVASLYVTPKNAKSNLVVDGIMSSGENHIIVVKNNGTKRAILGKMDHIKVKINGEEYFLKDILNPTDLESAVLADQTKNLLVSSDQLSKAVKISSGSKDHDTRKNKKNKKSDDNKNRVKKQESSDTPIKRSDYFDKNMPSVYSEHLS